MILLKLLAGSCCQLAANVAFPIGFVPQSSFLQPSRMVFFSVELGFPMGKSHPNKLRIVKWVKRVSFRGLNVGMG
jgi:hypothetical protein